MKSIVTFIAVCIVGYWLYGYYEENSGELPSLTHRAYGTSTTPIPDVPQDVKPAAPDLTSVPVGNGRTLTHVRVKDARANSLVLLCDQGLFEINYDRLSPDFRTYYAPVTPTPAVATDAAPVQAPAPTPLPVSKPQPQRSSQDQVQAQLSFDRTKAGLEQHQRDDLDLINRWYKQSSFEPGGITQSQFDTTKADYEATTAQLNQLVAIGP